MRFPYHGAGIGLVLDGKILMGKRSDTPFYGQWSFPGGCRELGDADELSTAIREFNEETGLDFESLSTEYLCRWSLKIPFFSWTTYFFRIQEVDRPLAPHEFSELVWLDPKEVLGQKDEKKHFRPFTKSEVRRLMHNL